MDFKQAFKFPVRIGWGGTAITDSEYHKLADFMFYDEERQQILVDIINGDKEITRPHMAEYIDGHIVMDGVEILLIRGWGYLTGTGGLHLPEETALTIQDELAAYIVDRLTPSS